MRLTLYILPAMVFGLAASALPVPSASGMNFVPKHLLSRCLLSLDIEAREGQWDITWDKREAAPAPAGT